MTFTDHFDDLCSAWDHNHYRSCYWTSKLVTKTIKHLSKKEIIKKFDEKIIKSVMTHYSFNNDNIIRCFLKPIMSKGNEL